MAVATDRMLYIATANGVFRARAQGNGSFDLEGAGADMKELRRWWWTRRS